MSTVTLKAECLCRAHAFAASIPASALPLRASSCHCTSCRHVTGALRSCDAPWPDQQSVAGCTTLRRYAHSPRVNVLFCGTCGTGMFFEEDDEDAEEADGGDGGPEEGKRNKKRYGVFTGVLEVEVDGKVAGPGSGVVRYEDHVFVGDTRDGGAACWLRAMNGDGGSGGGGGHPVKTWLGRRGQSEEVAPGVHWPAVDALPASYETTLKEAAAAGGAEGNGNVPVRCHCRGVDLVLRAGEAQREFAARQAAGEKMPWWVDPVTHKLIGGLDGCRSCRVWGGSEVFNWTFSLLKHLSFAGPGGSEGDKQSGPGVGGGLPLDAGELRAAVEAADGRPRDPRLGTLAVYNSSPGVHRFFCGRCSAAVFYAVDDRPELVDVAVGLLDSPDGARAESVISWAFGGNMVWRQDMMGSWREDLMHAVEKESEQWRIERGYPKNWNRVAMEQAAEKAVEEAQ